MNTSNLLAAIAFDPGVRGILVVLVGVTVLMGSIFLLLATNSGPRTGFLIAGSALFGWMFLMGSAWTIYGIGLKGRDPAWMALEINYDRSSPTVTPVVDSLPAPSSLPKAADVLAKYPLLHAIGIAGDGENFKSATLTNLVTLAYPLAIEKPADVTNTLRPNLKKNSAAFIAQHPELDPILAESDADLAATIKKQARQMRAEIDNRLNGWCLLPESDARRGDAVSNSDATIVAGSVFGSTTSTANYITQDVFFHGGKDPCHAVAEYSLVSDIWHRVYTVFEVKNPPLYAVVTLTKALDQPTVAGQAPPKPKVQTGVSTISVIQERNLGNRRFIPFCFTIVMLTFFVLFVSTLHRKDKMAMANRAAFEKSGA